MLAIEIIILILLIFNSLYVFWITYVLHEMVRGLYKRD